MSTRNSFPLRRAAGLVAVACLIPATASAGNVQFEGLQKGQIVSSLSALEGGAAVQVWGSNSRFPGQNTAVAFDSSEPSGGDKDLGTPHEDFDGPGKGWGGREGSDYQNDTPLGMILIVAEDLVLDEEGRVADPDDEANSSGVLAFDFADLGTVTFHDIQYMDIENGQNARAKFFAPGGALLSDVALPAVGNNGVNVLDLGAIAGVERLEVHLAGSGALTGFDFDQECEASVGDRVWSDLDGDGLQDAGEPGIEGVTVELLDGANQVVATTTTGSEGEYDFGGLCAGDYGLRVDETTLPEGFVASPCGVGGDAGLDSDCQPASLSLDHGELRDDVDFGYEPVPFVYCESLANSTGLAGEIDFNGSTSISANDLELVLSNLPPNKPAFLFYGLEPAEAPFGEGVRCIGPPFFRYRKVPSTGPNGTVTVPLDFTLPPLSNGAGQVEPGGSLYFQLWHRDPQGGPEGFNTTGALCVTFAP